MDNGKIRVISFRGTDLSEVNDAVYDLLDRNIDSSSIFNYEITKEQYDAMTQDGIEFGFFSYSSEDEKRNVLQLASSFFARALNDKLPEVAEKYLKLLNGVTETLEMLSNNEKLIPMIKNTPDRIFTIAPNM